MGTLFCEFFASEKGQNPYAIHRLKIWSNSLNLIGSNMLAM